MIRFTKLRKGFTLIELLIVIAVVGLLAILVITMLRGSLFKGNDSKRKADLDRIKIALEEYEKDKDCYPFPQSMVVCKPGTGLQPYLSKIPCDPVTDATYYYEYEASSCPSWFRVYVKLDNPDDPKAMGWCGGPNNDSFNYYVSSPNAPVCASTTQDGGEIVDEGGSVEPTPTPGGSVMGFYGCKNGSCVQISWDPTRPGPECDPNFQEDTCSSTSLYDTCSIAGNACNPWR